MQKNHELSKGKTVGITIRVDGETNRILSAILSLKGMTWSGFMHGAIETFIKDNYDEAKELFDISKLKWKSGGGVDKPSE